MIHKVRAAGLRVIPLIEDFGLIAVLAATLVAGFQEVQHMIVAGRVTVTDLLLLFIYIEVVSMVEVYWQQGTLPIRMPLYIAMVALARYLMLDTKNLEKGDVLFIALAILVLAMAVLAVRYGHLRFPYPSPTLDDTEKSRPKTRQ